MCATGGAYLDAVVVATWLAGPESQEQGGWRLGEQPERTVCAGGAPEKKKGVDQATVEGALWSGVSHPHVERRVTAHVERMYAGRLAKAPSRPLPAAHSWCDGGSWEGAGSRRSSYGAWRKTSKPEPEPEPDPEQPADRLDRLARNEPVQAATHGAEQAMAEDDRVSGWTRGLEAEACELCRWWWRNGRVWQPDHPMPRHTGCVCHPVPVVDVSTDNAQTRKQAWEAARRAGRIPARTKRGAPA